MATCKTTTKIRSRGEDHEETVLNDPCENPATQTPWIDIKRNKRVAHERGRGSAFQKTIYNYSPQCTSTTRSYEEDLDIVDPRGSQHIHYRKNVKSVRIESGRGSYFQEARIGFCNGEENTTRQVRIKRVRNEETGDYIDVERIDRYQVEHGRGSYFQGKRVFPKTQDEDLDDECPA